jgi:hypothetical protein
MRQNLKVKYHALGALIPTKDCMFHAYTTSGAGKLQEAKVAVGPWLYRG